MNGNKLFRGGNEFEFMSNLVRDVAEVHGVSTSGMGINLAVLGNVELDVTGELKAEYNIPP